MKLKNIATYLVPLNRETNELLDSINHFPNYKKIKSLAKQRRIKVYKRNFDITLVNDRPFILLTTEEESLQEFVEDTNKNIRHDSLIELFKEFSNIAFPSITSTISPDLVGLDSIKKASCLQLFSKERFHILLLGDPGVGKTKLLSSLVSMSPIAAHGLGSGTSSVGLAVTVKGKEILPGLLAIANNGICAIDELNLMKKEDRASLYSAMEDGFITYDKGGNHFKFDASCRIIAAANPIMDKFRGGLAGFRRQIPFDLPLISRFHLVFIIRKPSIDKFLKIARNILKDKKPHFNENDIEFIKGYVEYALSIKIVNIPKEFEDEVINFIEKIKKNENNFLFELSPRIVVGLTRIAKARARSELRDTVNYDDIEIAKDLLLESLKYE